MSYRTKLKVMILFATYFLVSPVFAENFHQNPERNRTSEEYRRRPIDSGANLPNSLGTSRVLELAQNNINQRVGNGQCSALAGRGPVLGTVTSGGVGIEQVVPGMVLRLSPGTSFQGSMGTFKVGSPCHFIVVESIDSAGNITFLDQNWLDNDKRGQKIRRANANLRTLRGSASIYSGN